MHVMFNIVHCIIIVMGIFSLVTLIFAKKRRAWREFVLHNRKTFIKSSALLKFSLATLRELYSGLHLTHASDAS